MDRLLIVEDAATVLKPSECWYAERTASAAGFVHDPLMRAWVVGANGKQFDMARTVGLDQFDVGDASQEWAHRDGSVIRNPVGRA